MPHFLNAGELKKFLEQVPDAADVILYNSAGFWNFATSVEIDPGFKDTTVVLRVTEEA